MSTDNTMILAQMDWDRLGGFFQDAIWDTLYMVSVTLLLSGILGLLLGLLLYTTRSGGILENRPVYFLLNLSLIHI